MPANVRPYATHPPWSVAFFMPILAPLQTLTTCSSAKDKPEDKPVNA